MYVFLRHRIYTFPHVQGIRNTLSFMFIFVISREFLSVVIARREWWETVLFQHNVVVMQHFSDAAFVADIV